MILSGTYDFHINGHSIITDAIENFNEAELGVNNKYIHPDKKFINDYRDATRFDINDNQFKNIIKREPALK